MLQMWRKKKKMTRNNADLTSKAIAERRIGAHFTTQIVFVLFTSRMVFVGNEDVETDILNSVDTLMNVLEEVLVGIYTEVVHVSDVNIFQWHPIFVNSALKVIVNNAQSRKLI